MPPTTHPGPPPRPAPATDDAGLVRAARSGDRRAFDLLHDRYARVVTRVVRAETRLGTDADDIVQEVFVAAWTRLASLREPERFRAWLLQIARHQVIDHARARGCRPLLDADDDTALELVETDLADPAGSVELAELAEEIREGMTSLSRRDLTAITLAAQLGFGPAEIAAALDVTPGNAKVVLHRARRRLRATLDRPTVAGPGRRGAGRDVRLVGAEVG